MDSGEEEDVSARVLLRNVLGSELIRSPVTRSVSQAQADAHRRRSLRVRNLPPAESPQVVLRHKLKQKLHQSSAQSPAPPSKRRRSQGRAVKTPAVTSSSLYDDDITPRGLLRGIIQTEAEASLLLSGQPALPDTNQQLLETSVYSSRPSEGASGLDLPDLVTEPLSNVIRGMSRRRPPPTFNVSAFERQLEQQSGERAGMEDTEQNTDVTEEQDLSAGSKSVLSLTLKTPFVNIQSERAGLRRKAANRRQPSVDAFDEAVQNRLDRHCNQECTVVQDGRTLGDSDWQKFTLGLSNVTVPDLTTDIVMCNTELYPQPPAATSPLEEHDGGGASELHTQQGDQDLEAAEKIHEDVGGSRQEQGIVEDHQEDKVVEETQGNEIVEDQEEEVVEDHQEEEEVVEDHQEEEEVVEDHQEEEEVVEDHQEEEEVMEDHQEDEVVEDEQEDEVIEDTQDDEVVEDPQRHSVNKTYETEPQPLGDVEDPGAGSSLHLQLQLEDEEEQQENIEKIEEMEEMEMVSSPQEKESDVLSLDDIPFAPTQAMAEPLPQEGEGQESGTQEVEEVEEMGWRDSVKEDLRTMELPSQLLERVTRRAYRSEGGAVIPGVTARGRVTNSLGAGLHPAERGAHRCMNGSGSGELPSPASPSVSSTLRPSPSVTRQTRVEEDVSSAEQENIVSSSVHQSLNPLSPAAEEEEEEELEEEEEKEEEENEQEVELQEEEEEHGEEEAEHELEEVTDREELEVEADHVDEDEEDEDDAQSEELSMQTPAFIRLRKQITTPGALATPPVRKILNTAAGVKRVSGGVRVKSRTGSDVLPKSYVMSVFKHFAKTKVATDVYPVINEILQKYFDRLADDLEAFSAHARRKTIEVEDVELLMRRQGFVTDSTPVTVLIEKFLPLEYRKLLIPVATSGNKLIPNQRR